MKDGMGEMASVLSQYECDICEEKHYHTKKQVKEYHNTILSYSKHYSIFDITNINNIPIIQTVNCTKTL